MLIRYDGTEILGSIFCECKELQDIFFEEKTTFKLEDKNAHPNDFIKIDIKSMKKIIEARTRKEPIARQIKDAIPSKLLNNISKYQKNISESILTQQAFDILVSIGKRAGIVSMGAGSGFIEHLLELEGVNIHAYDNMASYGSFQIMWATQPWFNVIKYGEPNSVSDHNNCALLLACPDNSNMAVKTLHHYKGNTLIYIGEGRDGKHANDAFFDYADVNYTLVTSIPLNTHYDVKDTLWVLKRNILNNKHIPKKVNTFADIIVEQQFVGAKVCDEMLSNNPHIALTQIHNGGFISWMTMAGASFNDACDTLRDYKKITSSGEPVDITEMRPKSGLSFNNTMIVLLKRLNKLYDV